MRLHGAVVRALAFSDRLCVMQLHPFLLPSIYRTTWEKEHPAAPRFQQLCFDLVNDR